MSVVAFVLSVASFELGAIWLAWDNSPARVKGGIIGREAGSKCVIHLAWKYATSDWSQGAWQVCAVILLAMKFNLCNSRPTKTNKNPVGRPETGRKLARYWLKTEVVREIERRSNENKFKRAADYLEYLIIPLPKAWCF
jgi:hypothetical protein